MSIEIPELDRMQREYKAAVEEWIAAIQQEGALASVNHNVCKSMHGRALGSARRKREKGQRPRNRPMNLCCARSSLISENKNS